MNKDTMNASRDAFVRLLSAWHPSLFAAVVIAFLFGAIGVSPNSPLLTWIQQKTGFVSHVLWQVALMISFAGICLARPNPRVLAILMSPVMLLGFFALSYSLQHEIPLLMVVFMLTSYLAIPGIIILQATVMKSIDDNANLIAKSDALVAQNDDLRKQLEALKVANATDHSDTH